MIVYPVGSQLDDVAIVDHSIAKPAMYVSRFCGSLIWIEIN